MLINAKSGNILFVLEYDQLRDLANKIIKSGIRKSHEGNHLMNEKAENFAWRLKQATKDGKPFFDSKWDLFLDKYGARFVGYIGEYVISELILKREMVITIGGDEGKDLFLNEKWWDVKTSFASEPMIFANANRHPETHGFIFCQYDPPDRLRIIQTNSVEEVFQDGNFKKAGEMLKWRSVKFDCYMPPLKRFENLKKFFNIAEE